MDRALARYLAGDPRAAARMLREAARLDAHLANLYQGLEQLNLGHPARAIEPLQNALKEDPGNNAVRQVLADAFYDAGRYYPAAAQLIQVTDASPPNTRAWYVLGRTWAALARSRYERILKQAPPDSAYGLAVAADGLMQRHAYRRALVIYNEALAKDPDLLGVRAAVAEIYRVNGRVDWAAREEELATRTDCTVHRLACEFRAGRHEAVLAATLKAQSMDAWYWQAQAFTGLANAAFAKLAGLPPSLELHRYRASLAWDAGQHAEVVEELRKALEFAPADRGLRRDLAMALGGAGKYDDAWRLARELLREEPDSPELNNLAGAALLNDQRVEEAIPFLTKALAARPNDLSIRASLGRAWMQAGRPARALPHLEAAASTDKDGSLHFQLAHAYQQTGRPELAEQAMAAYKELSAKPVFPPEPPLVPPE
jgi:predicted Zn-dependent protease